MNYFSLAGSFELAVIRMSRYFDLSNNHVLFVGDQTQLLEKSCMLPLEAFTTSGNTEEMTLVSQIFDCARTIAELKLSEVALSLYSAYILLQSGKRIKDVGIYLVSSHDMVGSKLALTPLSSINCS